MNENCDICQYLAKKPLQNQVLTSQYWTVGIISDQPYLGRALVTSLEHKPSLGQLSDEEWDEFRLIVRKLEPAYKQAFGAEPLNMGCFMNHAYRDDPPHSHVHWHVFPRYKDPVELNGQVFTDDLYGNFYDDEARRPVDDTTIQEIVTRLKNELT